METYARLFVEGADIEQVQMEVCALYPDAEHMTGLMRHLEKLKQEIEPQGPNQGLKEPDFEQPAGWTDEMTGFVESSLCGGNDVKATADLFRFEVVEAFDIQGLDEHIEKLKNRLINNSTPQDEAPQSVVTHEPLGWSEDMTAIIQGYLRNGDRSVNHMVRSLKHLDVAAYFLEGVDEYVTKLKLDFEAREQNQAT